MCHEVNLSWIDMLNIFISFYKILIEMWMNHETGNDQLLSSPGQVKYVHNNDYDVLRQLRNL